MFAVLFTQRLFVHFWVVVLCVCDSSFVLICPSRGGPLNKQMVEVGMYKMREQQGDISGGMFVQKKRNLMR